MIIRFAFRGRVSEALDRRVAAGLLPSVCTTLDMRSKVVGGKVTTQWSVIRGRIPEVGRGQDTPNSLGVAVDTVDVGVVAAVVLG